MRPVCLTLASLAVLLAAAGPPPKVRVSFDLITEKGFPITGSQQWHKTLSDLGVTSLRIHSGTGTEQAAIENEGTEQRPSYKVTGILKANNTLHLPGGKFSPRDEAAIRKWIADLGDQGPAGVTRPRTPLACCPSNSKRSTRI